MQYVNTDYGTDTPGNTVIGPQLPWGSINPSPDTKNGTTSGYNPDMPIRGFSQLHVSGTGGISRYGNILVSPQVGLDISLDGHDSQKSQEVAKAGYYAVKLERYNILTEISAAHHSAIYRFTFPESSESHIVFDLFHCIPVQFRPDAGIQHGEILIEPEKNKVSGWAEWKGGWGSYTSKYRVYFAAYFDKNVQSAGTWKGDSLMDSGFHTNTVNPLETLGGFVRFNTAEQEEVHMRIGVSMTSLELAESHLEREIPDYNFDKTRLNAENQWNRILSTILIDDPTATKKVLEVFYSNYYHCFIMPRDRTRDNIHGWEGPHWDDHYCGWDTYRTLFPLMTLVKESFIKDNINSFILRHEILDPYVSDAFIVGLNHRVQGGDNVDVMIADAFVKSVKGIDWDRAYSILKYHADSARHPVYLEGDRGYIFAESHTYATSVSLELSYNDDCVARVAKGLGKTEDFERYSDRSHNWISLWNPAMEDDGFMGFIHPKLKDSTCYPDLNLRQNHKQSFYEDSPWGYSYDLPHEIEKLIELMGGPEKFLERTIYYFESNLHYWGNEPSFLNSHLFHYIDRPDLSQKYTKNGMKRFTEKNGPPGNDDSGAMGSWYVLNAIGLFPVAGQDLYLLHPPVFNELTIQPENGKKIRIKKDISSPDDDMFSVQVNGESLSKPFLRHSDIYNGAQIKFSE